MAVATSSRFDPYRADILFLLIGANPLPNYVAAHLLSRPLSTIILLSSGATDEVADRLMQKLRAKFPHATFHTATIPESDGPAIGQKVDELVRSLAGSSAGKVIGLNYTGGTKPMSAYAYHSLAQRFPLGIFSYLDPRTLRMVIDRAGGTVQHIRIGDSVQLTLDEIAELHGYRIVNKTKTPRNLPFAQAIATVHESDDGRKQWAAWLQSWADGVGLPTLGEYPALGPAIAAFAGACGGTATETDVAKAVGFPKLRSCAKYFNGEWLEDITVEALSAIQYEAELRDFAATINLMSVTLPSEFDAVAVKGYQLFGISCIVTTHKQKAKEHLMEVFVRARQLGGDEARFAVVTYCPDKIVAALEQEVSREWDAAGKIRVFGSTHIPDLSTHLLQWFREASQEEA